MLFWPQMQNAHTHTVLEALGSEGSGASSILAVSGCSARSGRHGPTASKRFACQKPRLCVESFHQTRFPARAECEEIHHLRGVLRPVQDARARPNAQAFTAIPDKTNTPEQVRVICGRCAIFQPKAMADTLTGARFLLALYLFWLGINSGTDALPAASMTLLVAWISDLSDGPLARRDSRRRHTWIGYHDLAVALGVWVYLALGGFISAHLALIYGVAAAVTLWYFGSSPLAWGLQALPYAAMIWTSARHVPPYGMLLLTFPVFVAVVTWPRFPQRVLPEFLAGMRDLLRRRV